MKGYLASYAALFREQSSGADQRLCRTEEHSGSLSAV